MPKISFALHPDLLGFEVLQTLLDTAAESCRDSYPPYNIEQNENGYRISIAVAGFAKEELTVTIEGNLLNIRGMQINQINRDYAHQGISARKFKRTFVLAGCIELTEAVHENGLLNIGLVEVYVSKSRQVIEINKVE